MQIIIAEAAPVYKHFESGEPIVPYLDGEKALGIIERGAITVRRGNGTDAVYLRTLQKGDAFGAVLLFGGSEHFPTHLCANEKTDVVFFCRNSIETMIRKYPDIAMNYIQFLSDKVRFLNGKIGHFSAKNSEAKVAARLLSDCPAESIVIPNLSVFASSLSLGRASLYRAFENLEKRNAVRRNGKTVIITDRALLERIAEL